MTLPRLFVDGELLMENHAFIHESLADFDRQLQCK